VIEVGAYVWFSPNRSGEPKEIGVVVEVDTHRILAIEPKSFELDSWKSCVNTYRRFPEDVKEMTESEVVMFLLEK